MEVLRLLEELETQVVDGARFHLFGMALIDEEKFLVTLQQIRQAVPRDIVEADVVNRESQRMLLEAQRESERLRSEAKTEADHLLKNAREDSDRATSEARQEADRVTREAREDAEQLAATARQDCEKMRSDATLEAKNIVEQSREQGQGIYAEAVAEANRMVSNHETTQRAHREAERIVNDARREYDDVVRRAHREAERIHGESVDFAHTVMVRIDQTLDGLKRAVGQGRDHLGELIGQMSSNEDKHEDKQEPVETQP